MLDSVFICVYVLGKAMATHSSTLAWKIPWAEEPGGLPSMGSHRVRHDRSNLAAAATAVLMFVFLSVCVGGCPYICRASLVAQLVKWSTGEGNGKPLQYSCLENPMNSVNCIKRLDPSL